MMENGSENGDAKRSSGYSEYQEIPEAPVFTPTDEEWRDPLGYIKSISPIAEKAGICKIRPPPDWQPPFALDVDNLKFVPRIQRLNELEAKTRVKLNFLDSIAKFWELQGSNLRIPLVERKGLDLFTLHQIVPEEGGHEVTTKERKWSKVAGRMGYLRERNLGGLLKHHYDRILYPFDIFRQGKLPSKVELEEQSIASSKEIDTDYKPHGIPSRQAIKPPTEQYSRRSQRYIRKETMNNKNETNLGQNTILPAISDKTVTDPSDPLAKYICLICNRGDAEELMLLCDGCDDSYHTFCLRPPLEGRPKGDWRCPKCIAVEVSKPMEAFGFEQAKCEYNLQEFGKMADDFKTNYFNLPVHCVPCSTVEQEFWRIVANIDEDVTVEYGADLHTMTHGSGFPIDSSQGDEQQYCDSGWNLNNIPVLDGSVLKYIHADISGMKIPWMYVGMCFAAFCWHNEDHWSYSINYLHWGEPKTWYGVPGGKAEDFEQTMHKAAPELFQSQPDLLHQLVTILNPSILMKAGVPVCRTDQEAGEFVITFPRAYHAGFNQGYNFAEAVNFAPSDWLAKGRECIEHYSNLGRVCVFSHDELVCNMAVEAESLDVEMAGVAHQDMTSMITRETQMRKSLLDWGVVEALQESFELLQDDERQCNFCKTTCFLSAVTCQCTPNQLVCLRHYDKLCDCLPVNHTLRYRYTLDELPILLNKLEMKRDEFVIWSTLVTKALERKESKIDLADLKSLVTQAKEKKFPQCELLEKVENAVNCTEKCSLLAQKLICTQVRTRMHPVSSNRFKITVEELADFYNEILVLPVDLKETPDVKILLDKVIEFRENATWLLSNDLADSKSLQLCIDLGMGLDIDLPEIIPLKEACEQSKWIEGVKLFLDDPEHVTVDEMRKQLAAGARLPPSPEVERNMVDIQEVLTKVERFEERSKHVLIPKNRITILEMELIQEEGESIPAFLPTLPAVQETMNRGAAWTRQFYDCKRGDLPYMRYAEHLVAIGRLIPLRLDGLPILESNLQLAKQWKDRTSRTFLRKNSHYTLMEALSPRTQVGSHLYRMKKPGAPNRDVPPVPTGVDDNSATVVKAFKRAEVIEMDVLLKLRKHNLEKQVVVPYDGKYCVCQRGLFGPMHQCSLCKDWFHTSCVPIPKSNYSNPCKKGIPGSDASQVVNVKDMKFLCPCCLRTRRPRLETILALLVSLQKLSVRVPEGEALQCLTERAMNWQDRARHVLATQELSTAIADLSVIKQQLSEAAARVKTEKIITNELLKAASNPNLHNRVRAISSQSGVAPSVAQSEPGTSANPCSAALLSTSEHAYSAASKVTSPSSFGYLGKKHIRKSPLVPRQIEPPTLVLSQQASQVLGQLQIEGDLLEVSLDELNMIFRILQAAQPSHLGDYRVFEPTEGRGRTSPDAMLVQKRQPKTVLPKKRRLEPNACQDDALQKQKKPKKTYVMSGMYSAKAGRIKKKPLPGAVKEPITQKPRKNQVPRADFRLKGSSSMSSDQDTNNDKDDECASASCLHPTITPVDWVQCDGGCQKWFHMVCLGLSKNDIKETVDFICIRCALPSMSAVPTSDETVSLDALLSLANGIPDLGTTDLKTDL